MLFDDEPKIYIQSTLVEADIRAYVQSRIRTDRGLRKRQKLKVQLELGKVLVGKAGGMEIFMPGRSW